MMGLESPFGLSFSAVQKKKKLKLAFDDGFLCIKLIVY